MLILLSPAKSLDYASRIPRLPVTTPRLLAESERLVEVMRRKSVAELAALADISDELAALNAQRWSEFSLPFTRQNARPAVLAFDGDVYRGIDALYGVLRPLDLIQPYRLEMGTRVTTDRGNSLYDWWGAGVTDLLAADLAASPGSKLVVNLASSEYYGVVRPERLDAPVISPRFEDTNAQGRRSVVSFYAKRARGEMAAWLVTRRARTASAVKDFDAAGYRYDEAASTREAPVFVRSFADR